MRGRPGMGARRRTGRSADQQEGSAAFTYVMKMWEVLSDEDRLAWNVQGSTRRSHGINYFKTVNLRRARRGEELTRLPPSPKPYEAKPVLKRLVIRTRQEMDDGASLFEEVQAVIPPPESPRRRGQKAQFPS